SGPLAPAYPERTRALVVYAAYGKRAGSDDDYPWAATLAQRVAYSEEIERDWGGEFDIGTMAPGADAAMERWWIERCRASASPAAARDLVLMNSQIDVRAVLPAVQVPTLVLHRTGDRDSRV